VRPAFIPIVAFGLVSIGWFVGMPLAMFFVAGIVGGAYVSGST